MTNHFELPPEEVAHLYRRRWQVELFFKWIKQHLRIRQFYGRSENAIRCQIWAAICTYLLVALAKKELRIELSLYEMLQILSVTTFEETPIKSLFSTPPSDAVSNEIEKAQCLWGFLTGH